MASCNDIRNQIVKFTLELYGNNLLPRNIIQTFIDYISEFPNNILPPSLNQQICFLLENNCDVNVINDVKAILNNSKKSFDFVSTEHLRFTLYKKMG